MGLAASQARYLLLTARKTNVEYQGQQINQQRTELANQSAGVFTQLLSLVVPTAPSTSDYTTTSYTFSDGQNTCTLGKVTWISGDPTYNANVTYTYPTTTYTGVKKTRTDLGVRLVGSTYWLTDGQSGGSAVNKESLIQCNTTDTNYAAEEEEIIRICMDNPTSQIATDVGYDPGTGTISDITQAYYYTYNGVNNYYCYTDLSTMPTDGSANSLDSYYATDISSSQSVTGNAYIQKTDTGRYSKITLASSPSTSFDISSSTTTDTNAYNDAFNEYEYQQTLYQQEVTALNAKTSIIEQQDRTLELQLKQLDTEQEALQTEMESVKKVIEKNIEQTFKTFQ